MWSWCCLEVVGFGHCWPVLGQGLHLPNRLNGSAKYEICDLLNRVMVLVCLYWLKLFSHYLVEEIDQTTEQLIRSVLVDGFFVQVAGAFQAVDETAQIISR